jgi:hypothetical protein
MKFSDRLLVSIDQKTATRPDDAPPVEEKISQPDGPTKTIFSPVLNRTVEVSDDEKGVFVDGVRYLWAEVEEIQGLSPEALAGIHLVKEVFEGTIGEPALAPFNPITCKYGGVERGVHPDVCRWHAYRNDKNCHECIRFATTRKSVLERKEKFDGRNSMAG